MATPLTPASIQSDHAPASDAPTALSTLAALVIDTAVRLGVQRWVIAPGSRSAPLTVALAERADVERFVIYDERSAGYVALGLAQQSRAPVGLVCTSGTAAANFGPAVIEAFYQGVPLLVLTADRPPEWIDQQDNQAIRQVGMYGAHVRHAATLPVDDGRPDTRWFAVRAVADELQMAAATAGPVHLNVPLREPLYVAAATPIARPAVLPVLLRAQPALAPEAWAGLATAWSQAARILIVGGLHAPDPALVAALRSLAADARVAVIGDITSNLFPAASHLARWDAALMAADAPTQAGLAPDLVIHFGGPVTSRALKALLRSHPPAAFWRVGSGLPAPDTYQATSQVIPLSAAAFFAALAQQVSPSHHTSYDYANVWAARHAAAAAALDGALDDAPFGEFAAVRLLLDALPPGSHLQVGNSMPIRYANLLGPAHGHTPASISANRGTSGIDGTVSTAVGAALAHPDALTTLIVGDLGFFYDRNGLWHNHLPPNLRIALLNNHGGGIFDIIDGPDSLDAGLRRDYFLTPQRLSARNTAADHGLDYMHVTDGDALAAALPAFYAPSADGRPLLLEIETEMAANSAIYRRVRAALAAPARVGA